MEATIRLKTLHPSQQNVLDNRKRFNVLKNGRRWGKTEMAIDLIVDTLLDGDPVGYWAPTYKDLYEVWNELKQVLYEVIKEKNEQVKQIIIYTGGKVDFWSMEEPDAGRGRKYKRVIVDEAEKAPKFQQSWEQTIRPTLTDLEGDGWILSTPKGDNTYFTKTLFKYPEKYDDWVSWQLSTYDNPYIKHSEIEEAKRLLPDLIFRQEYMAESINMGGRPFLFCFEDKHVKRVELNPKEIAYLSFDFNVDPITCIVAQFGLDWIHMLDEFRLENSDLYALCAEIKAKYPHLLYRVTGDASGMNRSATTKGNINAYTIIMQEFLISESQIDLPSQNPPISESRTLCNALLSKHPNVYFDPKCKYLIEDCRYVQVKDDGTVDKSKEERAKRMHLMDAWRYFNNSYKSNFIELGY